MNNWIEKEQEYVYEVYPKRQICVTHGEGALLWDDLGREYIDCAAGIGVANVGHSHPRVVEAINQQACRLITCPGIFYNDRRALLLEKLVSISPSSLRNAFLCNSGAEAMEAAIKFARVSTGRNGFVSAMRGFHGRTLGALSATFKYRDEFEPLITGHRFIPFNNIEKLEAAVDENTAAVIIELVQGEGGVRPASESFAAAARDVCDRHGALLIIDEVQTGFGRTGAMFASDVYEIQPDMMTVAKAMAGGVPMGAVLCSVDMAPANGKHGSTFGGNPLACAASLATIETIIEEGLAFQAFDKGRFLVERLRQDLSGKTREIRHLGLMVGIELKCKARPILEQLMDRGILALPAGSTVIRLLPPLVITEPQLSKVCDTLQEVLMDH